MEHKVTADKGAIFIMGIVYTLLGGIFVIMGAIFAVAFYEQDAQMIGVIFAAIGSPFLILGIVFLVIQNRKKKTAQRLVDGGKYLWAEIVDLVPNFNVRINNRHAYIALARYVDGNGTVHLFKSHNLYRYPDQSFMYQQVKVYIEDNSLKKYYMDIEEILSKVQEH